MKPKHGTYTMVTIEFSTQGNSSEIQSWWSFGIESKHLSGNVIGPLIFVAASLLDSGCSHSKNANLAKFWVDNLLSIR